MSKDSVFCIVVALSSFLVYLTTISPSVNFIDSGELITVCTTLGIAHPTGYPLYTLIGRIFSLIPVGEAACRVNLLSAVFNSGAVFFLSLSTMALLGDKSRLLCCAGALLTAAFMSLSVTAWDVSTQTEVYSLSIFLYSVLIYLLLVGLKDTGPVILFLTAYLYGLSFGNHMMIVLLLPSVLFIIVKKRERIPTRSPAFILKLGLLFLLGLSIYAYLPIRSSLEPFLNWGNPSNLHRFLSHVSGWQYRVWMFSGEPGALAGRIAQYLPRLAREFTVWGVVVIALGVLGMLKMGGDEFVFLLITLAAGLFYAVNYDIPDIDPYYLPTYISLSLMTGIGAVCFLETIFRGKTGRLRDYIAIVLVASSIMSLYGNRQKVDKSQNRLAYYFGLNFLGTLDLGSLVLTKSWDLYSPIIYLQRVEGIRNDVVMVDFELMRRSWYVEALSERPVGHSEKTLRAMRDFVEAVGPFERGEPYNPTTLDGIYKGMLRSLLMDALARGGAYVDFLDEPELTAGYLRVPHLMSYEISTTVNVPVAGYDQLILDGVTDPKVPKDGRTRSILERYWIVAVNRGLFLLKGGRFDEAIDPLKFALELSPDNQTARKALDYCYKSLGRDGGEGKLPR
ncbi:MAG: protein O-mannosyl-transferase family [Candidatus Glassbacteria bacterium]